MLFFPIDRKFSIIKVVFMFMILHEVLLSNADDKFIE